MKKILLALAAPLLSIAALSARTVRTTMYSSKFFPRNASQNETFNKYRRLLIDQVARKAGWEVEFVDEKFDDRAKAIESSRIDFIVGARKSRASAKKFLFSEIPTYVEYDALVARSSDRRFLNGDARSAYGSIVGLDGGDADRIKTFRDFCEKNGIERTEYFYHDADQMDEDLRNGTIDLAFVSLHELPRDEKIIWNFGASPIYFMCKDPSIMREIDGAMEALKNENMLFRAELVKKINGASSLSFENFDDEEIEYIKKSPIITTLASDKSAPFSYIDGNGNFTGLSITFWNKISEVSGLLLDYVDAETHEHSSGENCLSFACSDEWNALQDDERLSTSLMTCKVDAYTRPNFPMERLLERGTLALKEGDTLRVATTRDQRMSSAFFRSALKQYETMWLDDPQKCLEKISSGEADIALIDEMYFKSMYSVGDYPKIRGQSPMRYEIPISVKIKGPDAAMLERIIGKALCQTPFNFIGKDDDNNALFMKYVPARHIARRQLLLNLSKAASLFVAALFVVIALYARKFKRLSETDDATGFWNTRRFRDMSRRLIQKTGGDFMLVSFNVSHFRHLNNTNGLEWGAALIRLIAQELRKTMSENKSTAIYATHGGDGVFYELAKVRDMEKTRSALNSYSLYLEERVRQSGFNVDMKTSVVYSGESFGSQASIQDMMDNADYARESIASSATARLVTFDKRAAQARKREEFVESRAAAAFDNKELYVVYQPKIDIKSGRLDGAEALARWESEDTGLVPPGEFIPMLDKKGLAMRLNFFVYNSVFNFLQSALDKGDSIVPVSVNLSCAHCSAEEFVGKFCEVFSRFSIPSEFIEIEIVERSIGMGVEEMRKMAAMLHEKGFTVALDSFGAGESSIDILNNVPVDTLKFDRNFISAADKSNEPRIILKKLIELSRQLGKKSVCEGVEKKSQVEFLREAGCDVAQGFYYSRPLKQDAFREYMESSL